MKKYFFPKTGHDSEPLSQRFFPKLFPIPKKFPGNPQSHFPLKYMNFSAYSTIGIGLHTDASYYCQPMGIQIFHVLEHKGNGGETMLSDGFTALKILLEQDQDAFKFLTEFNLRHEYKENGQPGHHLHSVGTVIGK